MNDNMKSIRNCCPDCGGQGVCRNAKHFFFGISLIASGILVFFQWPPIPSLIAAIERLAMSAGLPSWLGRGAIWTVASIPAVFGTAFLYAWLAKDTCQSCQGSCRSTLIGEN